MVALKVDVIVAPKTPAALAAKRATTTIPIVMSIAAGDPVGDGLRREPRPAGRQCHGLSALSSELVGKRLELLKEAVPEVVAVAVLWQPGAIGRAHQLQQGAEGRRRALRDAAAIR